MGDTDILETPETPTETPPASGPDVMAEVQKAMSDTLAPVLGQVAQQLGAMGGRLDALETPTPAQTPPNGSPAGASAESPLDSLVDDPEAFVTNIVTKAGAEAGASEDLALVLENQASGHLVTVRERMDARYGAGTFAELIEPRMIQQGFGELTPAQRANGTTVDSLARVVAGDDSLHKELYDRETKENTRMASQPQPGVPLGMPSFPTREEGLSENEKAFTASVNMSPEAYLAMKTGGEPGRGVRSEAEFQIYQASLKKGAA